MGDVGETENFQELFNKAHAEATEKEEAGEGTESAPELMEGLKALELKSVSAKDMGSAEEPEEETEEEEPNEPASLDSESDVEPEAKKPDPEEGEGDDEEVEEGDDNPEMDQLKKLAAKHGFTIDERRLAPQEKAKFHHWKREQRRLIDEEKYQAAQELEQTGKRLEQRFSKALEMEKAIESGDMDKIAELAGHKTFLDLNRAWASQIKNPVFLEQKRMKEKLAKIEEEREAERQHWQSEKTRIAQERAAQQYLEEVNDWVAESEFKNFSSDPDFANAIVALQKQHYDPHERTTLTVSEAAKLADRSARDMYKKLHKIYGSQTASQSDTPAIGATDEKPSSKAIAGTKKRGKKPIKSIPQKSTAEASGSNGKMSDEEFFAMATKELAQANQAS